MAITAAAAVLLVLVSASVTYVAAKSYYQNLISQFHPEFLADNSYKLLRPIMGTPVPGDLNKDITEIGDGVRSLLSHQPVGTLTRFSVYLRDLNTGNWTGVNANDAYDPASLLKVVVAISAYRQAEDQPNSLSTWLTYTPALAQINAQLPFALPSELQVGQSYSVPSLIKKELADSDNGAVYTLLNSIDQQHLEGVYDELSIPAPNVDNSVGYKLTAREYSSFFRILYNGTLDLNWDDSERILEDMSQSTFVSGLVAGVPNTITVAHKYGEHVDGSGGTASDIELSDCGIVYYPTRPYFLCVMVQGKDPGTLANVIAQVSKFVYQKINATTL
ncbi:MAG: serine hydrolase [Minisyncoccota bacterium]